MVKTSLTRFMCFLCYFYMFLPIIAQSQHIAKDSLLVFGYNDQKFLVKIEAKAELKIEILDNNFGENTLEPALKINVLNGKAPFTIKGEINDKVEKEKIFSLTFYPDEEQKITIKDARKRSITLKLQKVGSNPPNPKIPEKPQPPTEPSSSLEKTLIFLLLMVLAGVGVYLTFVLFLSKKSATPSNNIKNENPPIQPTISLQEAGYLLDLQVLWEDTQVSKMYITQSCASQIQTFLNQKQVLPLQQGQKVPEVGGYLLGKYQKNDEQYHITLQYFIPDEKALSDEFAISFHTDTQVLLDDWREKTDTVLLGWLHTHPGHSPFLSQTDLHTHEGFFRKPFQVAIVIDTLTPRWDTGIFTRKMNNSLNNRQDRQDDWISWNQVSIWQMEAKKP